MTKLKHLRAGDAITMFGGNEKIKYTVVYNDLVPDKKQVHIRLKKEIDGTYRSFSFMPWDTEIKRWDGGKEKSLCPHCGR